MGLAFPDLNLAFELYGKHPVTTQTLIDELNGEDGMSGFAEDINQIAQFYELEHPFRYST